MSTTQPKDLMTLEETECRARIAGLLLRDSMFKECGGRGLLFDREVDALQSALHHLEAGKDKRYTPQDMIFAAAFGINKLGENFPELKSTAPTAQEVKETICPGCGKPSNHMESGTTSDHWGVWHGECEKQFWMAGTGLDDRVPPFSKRNVEVKEEPC